LCFESKEDAEKVLELLLKRFGKFGPTSRLPDSSTTQDATPHPHRKCP
jgi:hypothetical protein